MKQISSKETLIDIVSQLYKYIKENNPSTNELSNIFNEYERIIIEFLSFYAVSKKDKETADKILEVVDILNFQLIRTFKKVVLAGRVEEYLEEIDWATKLAIYYIIELDEKYHLDFRKYTNLLKDSLSKDEEDENKKAIIEEWKKQNNEYTINYTKLK